MKRSDDDAFGRQLREAGRALTPDASKELHARVMTEVRRERAATSSARMSGRAAGWWWISAAAAAVVVIVAMWVTTSREPGAPPVARREIPSLPPVPSLEKVVANVEPMRTKLHEARFAYLDRDSKRLARFLIRAVPGVPSHAKAEATEGL